MQVTNKESFISTIYPAIVVNTDTSLDPDDKGRVQIYIPSVHYKYADVYEKYMETSDKKKSDYFKVFPWATTLVSKIKKGDSVYGSYVDGDSSQNIIVGVEGGVTSDSDDEDEDSDSDTDSSNSAVGDDIASNTSGIVNLALGIIMHNEIGVSKTAWKNDSISSKKFSTITLHDGGRKNSSGGWAKQGCWAIGLIQWNGVRAYDTMYSIVKELSNWKSYFTRNCDLKKSLSNSLKLKKTSGERGKYSLDKGWNPEKGGATYNAIKNILSTDVSKRVQKKLAYNASYKIIKDLVNKGCNNPAILIYMADFYNQYGSGYPETTKKCKTACSKGKTFMKQLDWLIKNQLKPNFSSFNTYKARRTATYNYIADLYNKGKLSAIDKEKLSQEQIDATGTTTDGNITFIHPTPDCKTITSGFGHRNVKVGSKYHEGIDLSGANAMGKKIYASHSGTVIYAADTNAGYGKLIKIKNGKYETRYAHQSKFKKGIKKGVKVKQGDLIGYVGSTGRSTGAHLHFEIRINGTAVNPVPYLNKKKTTKKSKKTSTKKGFKLMKA